eukprot:gb/GEZN01010426.1/.p1 GENE.gb/GEZN01010426.1/~~gb/GEZN01010426.1/.p1  ORF type:complete len:280 (+),score=13.83 gb/GEZN01010426.1/:84-923(+)
MWNPRHPNTPICMRDADFPALSSTMTHDNTSPISDNNKNRPLYLQHFTAWSQDQAKKTVVTSRQSFHNLLSSRDSLNLNRFGPLHIEPFDATRDYKHARLQLKPSFASVLPTEPTTSLAPTLRRPTPELKVEESKTPDLEPTLTRAAKPILFDTHPAAGVDINEAMRRLVTAIETRHLRSVPSASDSIRSFDDLRTNDELKNICRRLRRRLAKCHEHWSTFVGLICSSTILNHPSDFYSFDLQLVLGNIKTTKPAARRLPTTKQPSPKVPGILTRTLVS